MFKQLILIFIGGGLGSALRYVIHYITSKNLSIGFPVGTLLVNVLGSFAIGLIYALSFKTFINNDVRLFLTIGFCGGFTTFSTFAFDGLQLMRGSQPILFIAHVWSSVGLCLLFVWLGDYLGKLLINR